MDSPRSLQALRRAANVLSRYYASADDFAAVVTYSVAVQNPFLRFLLRQAPIAPLVFRTRRLRQAFCSYNTTERIVEIPFVLRHFDVPKGSSILDFGCAESILPLEFANMGYRVTGIDLRPYPFDHPNLYIIQGDIRNAPIPPESFEAVVCVSTLEHVGLDAYGGRVAEDDDLEVMGLLRSALRRGGRLFLTVPYGRGSLPGSRVYDDERLDRMIRDFSVTKAEFYYKRDGRYWILSDRSIVGTMESVVSTQGVALIAAAKP